MVFHYKGAFTEVLPSGNETDCFISGITGPTTSFNRYAIKESFGIFGAFLYPFAIPALFGVPASAVCARWIRPYFLPFGHWWIPTGTQT